MKEKSALMLSFCLAFLGIGSFIAWCICPSPDWGLIWRTNRLPIIVILLFYVFWTVAFLVSLINPQGLQSRKKVSESPVIKESPSPPAPSRSADRVPKGNVVRARIYIFSLFALMFLMLCLPYYLIRSTYITPFEEHLSVFSSDVKRAEASPHQERKLDEGCKMLIVYRPTSKSGIEGIDSSQYKLPAYLRANSPDEVTAIIVLKQGKALAGNYTNGAKGYVVTYDITVIDNTKSQIVREYRIVGPNPENVTYDTEDKTGDNPDELLMNFIISSVAGT